MSLNSLSCDLILNILDYIWNEYELKIVKILNKRFYSLINNYGTEREINVCLNSNMTNFIQRYVKNRKCVRVLNMCRVVKPTIWIPCEWPKIVEFIGCDMKNYISPPVVSYTTELVIKMSSYRERMSDTRKPPLNINFKKLPNLQILKVRCLKFDFKCLKYARKLKSFNLKLIQCDNDKICKDKILSELRKYINPDCSFYFHF